MPEVEKYWLKAKTAASDTLDPSSPDFYALVVSILKKMLKNKEGSKEEEMSAYERPGRSGRSGGKPGGACASCGAAEWNKAGIIYNSYMVGSCEKKPWQGFDFMIRLFKCF